MYIADYYNHRITSWRSDATVGEIIFGKSDPCNRLSLPVAIVIDKKKNCLITSECKRRRIVR